MAVTEHYIGGISRELWNDRADNKLKPHRREPRFAEISLLDIVKAPVPNDEVNEWIAQKEDKAVDPSKQTQQNRRARYAIREKRLAECSSVKASLTKRPPPPPPLPSRPADLDLDTIDPDLLQLDGIDVEQLWQQVFVGETSEATTVPLYSAEQESRLVEESGRMLCSVDSPLTAEQWIELY